MLITKAKANERKKMVLKWNKVFSIFTFPSRNEDTQAKHSLIHVSYWICSHRNALRELHSFKLQAFRTIWKWIPYAFFHEILGLFAQASLINNVSNSFEAGFKWPIKSLISMCVNDFTVLYYDKFVNNYYLFYDVCMHVIVKLLSIENKWIQRAIKS